MRKNSLKFAFIAFIIFSDWLIKYYYLRSGRYLENQHRLKISSYLLQLEKALEHKSMQNWKAERKSLTGHDLSLLQTFAQSWEQLKEPISQKLFIMLGFCAPNMPMPPHILEAALGDQADACDESLSELIGLGLLKEGPLPPQRRG